MSVNFIDTNILIYLFDDVDRRKSDIARDYLSRALKTGDSIISYQVVQETLNVITKKLPEPATAEQAEKLLNSVLLPLWKVNPSRDLYNKGIAIQARYQFSFYDSLIVAAALEAGCSTLYSEDLQHGQRIEQLTVIDPFREKAVTS
jgi:predicted nucleic acid-binding protein